MRITQTIHKLKIVIIFTILLWLANHVATAIDHMNLVKIYLIIGASIVITLPYIIRKIGVFPLLCGLVFMYWIPVNAGLRRLSPDLHNVYPTEFGVWMLCIGVLIYGSVSQSGQRNSTGGRFPFLPFSLFIGGALLGYLKTGHYCFHSSVVIRTFCLLPALFCFLCIYLIRTVKQAERLLWIFLISAGLFGILVLFGPEITNEWTFYLIGISKEAFETSGRLVRIIHLPLFGLLYMPPSTAGVSFAFIVALSFNLWLNHPSFWGRLVAGGILAISGGVIVQTMGRAGLIAGGCSVVVITALSSRSRKYSFSLCDKLPLKPAIVFISLFVAVCYRAVMSPFMDIQIRGRTLLSNPLTSHVLDERITRWKNSLSVFFDDPFFGVGVSGIPSHVSYSGSTWYAHNLYLYLLLSFGVIGFIGFLWIFVRYTKACWSGLHSDNLNRKILCIGGIGCATVLFVAGIPSCICWYPWEILTVWIPVGITMAAATLPDEEAKQ